MGPAMFGTLIFVVILIVFLLAIIVANIKIVPQAHAFVVERLGAFHASWGTGLHVKIPFIDRIAKKVSLKEQVIDFPPQPVITKDNVTMQIDTVVYFQITDPKLYAYGVENPISAIENLTATTLRNIIGEMELDHTLTSRDVDQQQNPGGAGRGHRRLGHQGQPGGAEKHRAAQGNPGFHGEADEGRAGAPGQNPGRRGREAQRHPHRRGREGVRRAAGRGRKGDENPGGPGRGRGGAHRCSVPWPTPSS